VISVKVLCMFSTCSFAHDGGFKLGLVITHMATLLSEIATTAFYIGDTWKAKVLYTYQMLLKQDSTYPDSCMASDTVTYIGYSVCILAIIAVW
jgi:hypothetical protein